MNNHLRLFIIILFFTNYCVAEELYEVGTNARALGMGNAYSAVVKDADSVFYNPAGLAQNTEYAWRIIDLGVGLDGQEAYEKVRNITSSNMNFMQAFQSLYGTNIWVGANAKTEILAPGISFGVYDSGYTSVNLDNPAYPNFNIDLINDMGYFLGVAGNFSPMFSVGLVGKKITRSGYRLKTDLYTFARDSEKIQKQLLNKGTGYEADIGMRLNIPAPGSPTFSFVWKNLGYTKFSSDDATLKSPPSIRDEMIMGYAMNFDMIVIDITPSIDYKYINRPDVQMGKKVHLGLEVGLPFVDVRAGFNQGYYTLGATLDLFFLKFEVASYGVEIGDYPGQREDRRYLAQLTLEVGFDPGSFSFTGSTNKKERRKLKQRR